MIKSNGFSGINFESPEQWGQIKHKIGTGLIPCPVCGRWRTQLWWVPKRYKLELELNKDELFYYWMLFEGRIVRYDYACDYCIAELVNRKRERETFICCLCRKRYPRLEKVSLQESLTLAGFGHHKWRKIGIRLYPDAETSYGSLGLACLPCSGDFVRTIKEYAGSESEYKKFMQKRTMHIARSGEKEDDKYLMAYSDWIETLDYFGNRCAYCGKPGTILEHFRPVSKGGKFAKRNILPSCIKCNSSKLNHDPFDWIEKRCNQQTQDKILDWVSNKDQNQLTLSCDRLELR